MDKKKKHLANEHNNKPSYETCRRFLLFPFCFALWKETQHNKCLLLLNSKSLSYDLCTWVQSKVTKKTQELEITLKGSVNDGYSYVNGHVPNQGNGQFIWFYFQGNETGFQNHVFKNSKFC